MSDTEIATAALTLASKVSEGALDKLILATKGHLVRAVKGPTRAAAVALLAEIEQYGPYLQETHDRVSLVKTFVNPNKSVRLLDQYVSITLENSEGEGVSDNELLERIVQPTRTVIQATAGYGKSILMRYLAIHTFENPTGRLPLFIELRELNRLTTPNLLSYIHQSYKKETKLSQDVLVRGLENGAFILLLDGFDELNYDIRDAVEAQLLEFSKQFKRVPIVVSGRPDEKFRSWRLFDIFQVRAMSKERVVELISKLDFDEGTKDRFIEKIKDSLYDQHRSFLSTPLLAVLMLLTYQKSANIPEKMHLFYENAFDALFDRHDALKEQFERKRKSGLRIDEFERLLSVFCLETYVKQKIEFSRSDMLRFISSALSFSGFSTDPAGVLFDFTESLCLIQKEGPSYSFIHRSFQEYFTSLFLARAKEDVRQQFIEEIAQRTWDNVLPMLFDMAQDQIEPTWVLKNLKAFIEHINDSRDKTEAAILAMFPEIVVYQKEEDIDFFGFGSTRYSRFITVMSRFYRQKMSFRERDRFTYENLINLAREVIELSDIEVKSRQRLKDLPNNGQITRFLFGPSVRPLFDKYGITDYAVKTVSSLEEIYQSIDGAQLNRSKFLDRLFSQRDKT